MDAGSLRQVKLSNNLYRNRNYGQENLPRLFHEIIQFDAARLQNGGGSGLGLWSKIIFCI